MTLTRSLHVKSSKLKKKRQKNVLVIVGTVVVIGAGVVVVVLLSITVGRRTKVGKFNRTFAQHNSTEKKNTRTKQKNKTRYAAFNRLNRITKLKTIKSRIPQTSKLLNFTHRSSRKSLRSRSSCNIPYNCARSSRAIRTYLSQRRRNSGLKKTFEKNDVNSR